MKKPLYVTLSQRAGAFKLSEKIDEESRITAQMLRGKELQLHFIIYAVQPRNKAFFFR